MPVYSYSCPVCGVVRDELRPLSDRNFALSCDECGAGMSRLYTPPNLGGDLPATGWRVGCVGYDEGLDEVVLSATHRKQIMERKGLQEYSPDPERKKVSDEKKYIRKHAPKREAAAACRKMSHDAAKERRLGLAKKKVREGLKDL